MPADTPIYCTTCGKHIADVDKRTHTDQIIGCPHCGGRTRVYIDARTQEVKTWVETHGSTSSKDD